VPNEKIPPASARPRLRLTIKPHSIQELITTLAALATVMGGIIGVYVFFQDSGPPSQEGEIRDFAIVSNETYGSFLDRAQNRTEESLATLAPNFQTPVPEVRNQPGMTLSFDVMITGYEGQPSTLRWSMYDAETRELLSDPAFVDQFGFPEKYITPNAGTDERTVELWVPVPRIAGSYYVRVVLYDPDGRRLDAALSENFDVEASDTMVAFPTADSLQLATPLATPRTLQPPSLGTGATPEPERT
jgi:hypothetical protein